MEATNSAALTLPKSTHRAGQIRCSRRCLTRWAMRSGLSWRERNVNGSGSLRCAKRCIGQSLPNTACDAMLTSRNLRRDTKRSTKRR